MSELTTEELTQASRLLANATGTTPASCAERLRKSPGRGRELLKMHTAFQDQIRQIISEADEDHAPQTPKPAAATPPPPTQPKKA